MKADALRGHLDAMILAVVKDEPLHGYGISEALHTRSDGAIDLPTGTLYPALRRLERLGYLRSAWDTVGGRKRRTYQVTRDGRAYLVAQQEAWNEMNSVVSTILGTNPAT